MPFTGDFSKLRKAITGLRTLATQPAIITQAMADEVRREVNIGFVNETDPYGQKWAPHMPATVKRWKKHPLLRLTGAGVAGIRVIPNGPRVTVSSSSKGLNISQDGWERQEPRRWKPLEGKPSAVWDMALTRGATAAITGVLRGTK